MTHAESDDDSTTGISMADDLGDALRQLVADGHHSLPGRRQPPALVWRNLEQTGVALSPPATAVADRIMAARFAAMKPVSEHDGPQAQAVAALSDVGRSPVPQTSPPSPRHPATEVDATDEPTVISPNRRCDHVASPDQCWRVEVDGRAYTVHEGQSAVVGRGTESCDIAHRSRAVSRRQLSLESRLGQLMVTEFGSTNGTSLCRGQQITPLVTGVATTLLTGDTLVVTGRAELLVAVIGPGSVR